MRLLTLSLALLGIPVFLTLPAESQEIPREEYLKQVPLSHGRLVQQTASSRDLHLFGDPEDPSYRDVDPLDGIDDARHGVLMTLAIRFAPYLVQNTTNVPTNFDVFIENRDTFALHVDTWATSSEKPRLVETGGVNFSVLGQAECPSSLLGQAFERFPHPTTDGAIEDCKLLELIERYTPGGGTVIPVDELMLRERDAFFDVLFFDLPGEGDGSWKVAFQPEYERTPAELRRSFPQSYVHPFLSQVAGSQEGERGYELVFQYWFYFPSNDSGNNHEGDWEHINVVISPVSMVEGALTAETVRQILSGSIPATDQTPDPLVIKRVDYYFHHFVTELDFSTPNVYQPRRDWEVEIRNRPETRFKESEIWKDIRYMAYADDEETMVNTHAFAYIGADNKGLSQALVPPGGRNRDPHGILPFPGRYVNAGPGGTTDQISSFVDSRRFLEDLRAGRAATGPTFKRGAVLGLADPDRLRILPDWERVVDLVRTDVGARRDWAWMVLPIRWGYPATRSPFSGTLEFYDMGNVSPVGPSYNERWNVTGPGPGFALYEPHTIPPIFPLQLQDSFRNDLGFLNLTIPVLFNLPPFDFLSRVASYPVKLLLGRRDPVFYPNEDLPFRFVGFSSGISRQVFDGDFQGLSLHPDQYDQFLGRFLLHILAEGGTEETAVVSGREFQDRAVGPFFQIPFYLGNRFTSENTIRNSRITFGADLEFNNVPPYSYSADINYWEYAGSLRYSLTSSRFQPFLKAGYGWSWYRLENVQANGEPFDPPGTEWIGPGSVWPNVWHYGLGLEVVPWKRAGELPGGLDLAFRVEFVQYIQSLGLDLSQVSLSRLDILYENLGDVPGGESVHRNDLLVGVTVSF